MSSRSSQLLAIAGHATVWCGLCLSVSAGLSGCSGSKLPTGPRWELVWSDEFDKDGAPDPDKWDYEQGFVRNGESQFYTANRRENARIENGVLVLEARKEAFANPLHQSELAADPVRFKALSSHRQKTVATPVVDYTAASLITRNKAAWKYGRIEVRARLPQGRGIWPAIWMLGTKGGPDAWPACGEIDIMEYVGFDPGVVHANVHNPARLDKNTSKDQREAMGSRLALPDTDAFHVYGIDWDARRIQFLVDDRVYFTYANSGAGQAAWPYDQPFYLLLNVAIGGAWGGRKGIDDAAFPQRMEIDYVRVYQRDSR